MVDGIASALDIVPTVAKLTGSAMPLKPVDGINILPMLTGQTPSMEREALLYFDNEHLQCARWQNWKLHVARYTGAVYSPAPAAGRQNLPLHPRELYNLDTDPEESYDTAAEHPDIVQEMEARIAKLMPGFPESVQLDWAATQERQTVPTPAGQWPRESAPKESGAPKDSGAPNSGAPKDNIVTKDSLAPKDSNAPKDSVKEK